MYPGTSRCFDSALWPLLRGDDVPLRTLVEELRELPMPVKEILFRPGSGAAKLFDIETGSILSAFPSFDALVATVLLMKIGEILPDEKLRRNAIETYLEMQPELALVPELAPVADKLFDAIDVAFKHWTFVGNYERLEVAIPSNRLRRAHGRVDLGVMYRFVNNYWD